MSWSEWQSLDTPSGHDAAAVYELRMINGDGSPVSVPRFLDADDRGLLTIGETGSMESRRRQFIYAVEKCSGHSEGNLLYYLLRHSPLKERSPTTNLNIVSAAKKTKQPRGSPKLD